MRRVTGGQLAPGLALVLAVFLSCPGATEAQSGMRGPGASIGGFHLIGLPAVQKELKMDDKQVAKSAEVVKRMNSRFTQDMGKLKGLNQDERAKRLVTLAPLHYEEGMKQLNAFLKPEQVERFDQILLQQRGPAALLEPKIAQTVQLTNEQAVKVAQVLADTQNEQKGVADSTGGKPTAEGLTKFREIGDRAYTRVDEILKPEQQRTWKRIVGAPFYPDPTEMTTTPEPSSR